MSVYVWRGRQQETLVGKYRATTLTQFNLEDNLTVDVSLG